MRRFHITALIVCLLLAQSALLAHELDHAEHGDGHACEYCAVSGSLDKPVADISVALHLPSSTFELQPSGSPDVYCHALAFNARAPPLLS